jgi:anti-anti-sigma factor
MRYSIEKTDDVVVARIHGDMWGKPEDRELKTEMKALAKQGERRFVIDFEGASAVSSTGIGIVVSSLTAIQGEGGRLRLCNLNQRVKATFEITGISKMVSIYDTVESALSTPWPH